MTNMSKKQDIRELLFQIEMARKRRIIPVWSEMGLIAGQPRVLTKLLMKDHITQKELSDVCGFEPATLSRALDRLEAMGYITRNDNPGCRRSFLIALTEEGKAIAGRVRQVFVEVEEEMMQGLSEEEMETLFGLLGRVYQNIQ